MKIALFCGGFPKDKIGGAELQTYLISKGMRELGHEVYYFAMDCDEGKPASEIEEGINLFRYRRNQSILRKAISIYFKVTKSTISNHIFFG